MHPPTRATIFRSAAILRLLAASSVLLIGAFLLGVGVVFYKWPPLHAIQTLKRSLQTWLPASRQPEYRGERELLDLAFMDPVNEIGLYYPPIKSLEGIREANQRIFMHQDGFETAYADLTVIDATQLTREAGSQPVVRVRFHHQGNEHEAFAYGRIPEICPARNWATLIVPGSGVNQSLPIASGDPENYHYGILPALIPINGRVFTLIKPNEDLLALHDGHGKKLHGNFIWNWHLNRDGSYSVSYLVQSLAFMKWMRGCFSSTLVAGLSQGGAAAMLNALQSRPDRAIVASGCSVLIGDADWSEHNQLIGVAQFSRLNEGPGLIEALRDSPTEWLFSWGRGETATYRIEANDGPTKRLLESNKLATVVIHNGGHAFPREEIAQWLSKSIESRKDE